MRDRDREFAEPERVQKAEVSRNFDRVIEVVFQAIPMQSEADWSKPYTAVREEDAAPLRNSPTRSIA